MPKHGKNNPVNHDKRVFVKPRPQTLQTPPVPIAVSEPKTVVTTPSVVSESDRLLNQIGKVLKNAPQQEPEAPVVDAEDDHNRDMLLEHITAALAKTTTEQEVATTPQQTSTTEADTAVTDKVVNLLNQISFVIQKKCN